MMVKASSRRDVLKALRNAGCLQVIGTGRGDHDKWACPCGKHTAPLPRHTVISPGVIRGLADRMQCLPKGWLS